MHCNNTNHCSTTRDRHDTGRL